jgi:hypothetical protein
LTYIKDSHLPHYQSSIPAFLSSSSLNPLIPELLPEHLPEGQKQGGHDRADNKTGKDIFWARG